MKAHGITSQRLRRKLLVMYLLMFVIPVGYMLVSILHLVQAPGVPSGLMSATAVGLLIGLPAAAAMSIAAFLLIRHSLGSVKVAADNVETFLEGLETAEVSKPQTEDEAQRIVYYVSRVIEEFRRHLSALDDYAQELYDRNKALASATLIDDVTGLYNDKHAMSVLEIEVHRAVRSGRPLSVMCAEVTNMPEIIERNGPRAGDRILQELAHLVTGNTRPIDLVARAADARLIAILPDATGDQAETVAGRLFEAVKAHRFAFGETGDELSPAISIGTGSLSEKVGGAEELVQGALTDMLVAGRLVVPGAVQAKRSFRAAGLRR